MLTFAIFVCLIVAAACIFCVIESRKERHGHVTAGYPLLLGFVTMSFVGLFGFWPAALSVECSQMGYCGIGPDDIWVWLWIVPVGLVCIMINIIILSCVASGEWAQGQCCGKAHTSWELMRYENQQERLASLGFTREECWAVLRDAIAVASELGEENTGDDGDHYEFTDDRIVVSVSGRESRCAIIGDKPDLSRCGENCRHGEEVLVSTKDSARPVKVLEAVNSAVPRVSIFRPGDWIAHLQADLSDTVASRVADRVAARSAAEAVAEEARKRERDSRFVWLEDLKVDGSPHGRHPSRHARS